MLACEVKQLVDATWCPAHGGDLTWPYLQQEVQVGSAGEHLEEEDGEEGGDVVLGRLDAVPRKRRVFRAWAKVYGACTLVLPARHNVLQHSGLLAGVHAGQASVWSCAGPARYPLAQH